MLGSFFGHYVKRTGRAPIQRRRATWLLLGWLAFWLTTAAHPFELCFTGELDHRFAVTTPTSGGHVSHVDHAPGPAPVDSHCPDVSAVTVDATSEATMKDDRLDAVHPPFGSRVPVAQRDEEMRNLKSCFPPPPSTIPLYLRTQRLLI